MAVGEINVTTLDTDAASIDFSTLVQEVGRPDTAFGYAFSKTLGRLGLEPDYAPTNWLPRMIVHGSTEIAQTHAAELSQISGLVARNASRRELAFQGHNERETKRILDELTEHTLPSSNPGLPLAKLALSLAYPFALAQNPHGVSGRVDGRVAPMAQTRAERQVAEMQRGRAGKLVLAPTRLDVIRTHISSGSEGLQVGLAS